MGLCAIVTRPAVQATAWAHELRAALRARGCGEAVKVAELPLICIRALEDTAALRAAWAGLECQALVFFVSANAVRGFFEARPPGLDWPQGTLAAAPGPGTATVLREAGVPASQVVSPASDAASFDSEQLWQELRHRDWAGRQVLIVRGEAGRDWLAEQLRTAGARPEYLAAYTRGAPELTPGDQALLAAAYGQPHDHLWLFSSSEAVQNLKRYGPVAESACALATHPRIAAAAAAAGFGQVKTVTATLEAVADAIAQASQHHDRPEGPEGPAPSIQSGAL